MFAICSGMPELPSAYPLRDLFDAAIRYSAVRLTCPRCGHAQVYRAAALWWLFQRKGWNDRFPNVRRRYYCRPCCDRHGEKTHANIALVNEAPTDDRLPMPSELDWKRERRRRQ
jgi:hypothetical protein